MLINVSMGKIGSILFKTKKIKYNDYFSLPMDPNNRLKKVLEELGQRPYDPEAIVDAQKEFFGAQCELITNFSNTDLLIYGNDGPFMDYARRIIQNRLKRRGDKSRLYAIVSEKDHAKVLEKLLRKTDRVTLLRTPEEIERGFITFGENRIGYWDSTRPSVDVSEGEDGVYLRSLLTSNELSDGIVEAYETIFNKEVLREDSPYMVAEIFWGNISMALLCRLKLAYWKTQQVKE